MARSIFWACVVVGLATGFSVGCSSDDGENGDDEREVVDTGEQGDTTSPPDEMDAADPGDAGRDDAGAGDAGEGDVDAGPPPSGPGSVIFEMNLPDLAGSSYTINLYDEQTGEIVAGVWETDDLEETTTIELREANDDSCITDEPATLPEGDYRAYLSVDTDDSALLALPYDTCETSGFGFISDGEEVADFEVGVAGETTVEVDSSDFAPAVSQQLQVENNAAADGAMVGCLLTHRARGPVLNDVAMLAQGSGQISDGSATIDSPGRLPSGEYRAACIIDTNDDGEAGSGDTRASKIIDYGGEVEPFTSWSPVE